MDGSTPWGDQRNAMMVFALRWAPFGGGAPDDIWETFGVTEAVFFTRMQQILGGAPPVGIDDLTWTRLRRVCQSRLTSPDPDAPPTDRLPA